MTIKKISQKEIVWFFRQFTDLVKANIPLLQSCELLYHSQINLFFKSIIMRVKYDIETGIGLGEALKKFPLFFNPMICQLITMGESSGTMDQSLQQITLMLEQSLMMRNKLKQALFYPFIVLSFACLSTLLMLVVVVPRFELFFQQNHHALPWLTRGLIHLSHFIRREFIFILCFTLFLTVVFKKYILIRLKRLSLIQYFSRTAFILQFLKQLNMLSKAGIALLEALILMHTYTFKQNHAEALAKMVRHVKSGHEFHFCLRATSLFPEFALQMIRLGEESGTLQPMLETLILHYETDQQRQLTRLHQLLEPLIIALLGALIGGLVIALYLPIFKIGMSI